MNEWVCGNEYGTDLNRFSECANKNNIKRFFLGTSDTFGATQEGL